MTPDERRNLMRRAIGEMWNNGNLDMSDEIYAAHCSFHDPSFPVDGVSGMKEQISQLRTAQPDLHVDVQEVLADADMTATRFTMGGTARAEFRGLPATGKTYVMTGMTMDKWEDDKIVEEWTNYDLLGALQQLGIIPEMAAQQATDDRQAREARSWINRQTARRENGLSARYWRKTGRPFGKPCRRTSTSGA